MRKILIPLVTVAMTLVAAPSHADGEVNLYSYRQPFLIEPMLEEFTNQTGTKVNVVFAKKGMIEKIKAAGDNNPADAVLTVDIGRLDGLRKAQLLEPVDSAILNDAIPAHLRHPDGLWFGLTTRARLALTSKERVKPGELETLADLADPKFKGRICSRSGKNGYNVALIASVIAHEGEEAAEKWLTGVRDNLARKPQGNDRAQAKGVHEGVCDIAISNHYYMGKMATNEKKPEQKEWAKAVNVQFLDQNGRGNHVNISGAAVIKGAKNRDNAVALLEFLAGDKAQNMYATVNFEFPVKAGIKTDPLVESWGSFKSDTLSLQEIANHRATATKLVDKTAFDAGPTS
jgi:iron(III) transport system substrate-binding protein